MIIAASKFPFRLEYTFQTCSDYCIFYLSDRRKERGGERVREKEENIRVEKGDMKRGRQKGKEEAGRERR